MSDILISGCIQLHQTIRQLCNLCADLFLCLLPFSAAQLIQLRTCTFLGYKFPDKLKLFKRYKQNIISLIGDMQKILMYTIYFLIHNSQIFTDTMLVVYYIISDIQLLIIMQNLRLFEFIAVAGCFFDTVKQFLSGIDTDLFLQAGKAFGKTGIQKLDSRFQRIRGRYIAPGYICFLQQPFHLFLLLVVQAEQNPSFSCLMLYLLHGTL